MTIEERILKISGKLEEAKNEALDCARDCSTSDSSADWQAGEIFLRVARSVKALHDEVVDAGNSRKSGNVVVSQPEVLRWAFPAIHSRGGFTEAVVNSSGPFPRYEVKNNALVKTGLSRGGQSTYEHVVPSDSYSRIVAALSEFASQSAGFTTTYATARVAVPQYQLYIVIALLKENGLLKQVRRGSFKFMNRDRFRGDAKELWNRLEVKKEKSGTGKGFSS